MGLNRLETAGRPFYQLRDLNRAGATCVTEVGIVILDDRALTEYIA